jgi:outer membrane protein
MKTFIRASIGAGLAVASLFAQAQSAGDWLFKIGINQISPKVTSGDLSPPSLPGTQINIDSATSAIFTAAYMLTDNYSIEAYAGLPYKHNVTGAGAIQGVGTIATIKQVSPTLFGQYRFLETNRPLRPYLGLGITYARFYGSQGTAVLTSLTNAGGPPTILTADSAWGVTPQFGLTFRLNDRWFLDASVEKTYIKTTSHLSTGQFIDVSLDPVSANVSIGYRF